MSWVEIFTVLIVCHLVGDFLLQTEWQALNKLGGLTAGDPVRRQALLSHVLTYALAFVPALVWIAVERSVLDAAIVVVVGIGTHLVQDDGTLLRAYVRRVKKTDAQAGTTLWMAIDQSAHIVFLFSAALLATI